MKSLSLHAGRRARKLVPSLGAQAIAVSVAQAAPLLSDDVRLFATTLAGGLVFFGTFLS